MKSPHHEDLGEITTPTYSITNSIINETNKDNELKLDVHIMISLSPEYIHYGDITNIERYTFIIIYTYTL